MTDRLLTIGASYAYDLGGLVQAELEKAFRAKPAAEVGQAWHGDKAKVWTHWIIGRQGVLAKVAGELGYKVEYEWFRTDQFWYRGMLSNGWDWDDIDAVAIEYENSNWTAKVLYDIRKRCTLKVPIKLFVGYKPRPGPLLSKIEGIIRERDRVAGTRWLLFFGWWRDKQMDWQHFAGRFEGGTISFS